MKRWIERGNKIIKWIDTCPLWWLGFILITIIFLPYCLLGKGCVVEIHDQLDESILNYLFAAKHWGSGLDVYPEMMGGMNATGVQPAGMLFVPLYKFFDLWTAFLIHYVIVCASGFLGMYFCMKELTKSSILATVAAGCFCLLPIYPVYGLSEFGVPMLVYAFLCLYQRKNKILSMVLILYFALTSHLVYTGYVMLGFWLLALLIMLYRKENNAWLWSGFLLLLGCYLVIDHGLMEEFLFGQSDFISHREEMVNPARPFWSTTIDVFLNSSQHAPSHHKYLIIPIVVILVVEAFRYKKDDTEQRKHFWIAAGGMITLVLIAFVYGFFQSEFIVNWKNSTSGFWRCFKMERFYWLYPPLWYMEFACAFALWWRRDKHLLIKVVVLVVMLLPTLQELKVSSNFYMNVNQLNNGSDVTGYITWENYYSEDLMEALDEAIGRDKTTYRVGHVGINPAPALVHGFYTIDGYSNNYSIEYKHAFRKIIATELEKNEETRVYFDKWGHRCYLFNGESGNYWMLGKKAKATYENLSYDMEALKALGCEYLFSGGEILNAEELGLVPMGYYETEKSYWGIWLYGIS